MWNLPAVWLSQAGMGEQTYFIPRLPRLNGSTGPIVKPRACTRGASTTYTANSCVRRAGPTSGRCLHYQKRNVARSSTGPRHPGDFDFNLSEYMVVLDKPIGLTLAPDPAAGQIVVQSIKGGSPADACQLIEVGDVITMCSAVSGEAMWPAHDLRRICWAIHNRTGKIKLILERGTATRRNAPHHSTWYSLGAVGWASCERDPLQLPVAFHSTMGDEWPADEWAPGRSLAVAFHRSTSDPSQGREQSSRAALARAARLQHLRDSLAMARAEPELDLSAALPSRQKSNDSGPGANVFRPAIAPAARAMSRTSRLPPSSYSGSRLVRPPLPVPRSDTSTSDSGGGSGGTPTITAAAAASAIGIAGIAATASGQDFAVTVEPVQPEPTTSVAPSAPLGSGSGSSSSAGSSSTPDDSASDGGSGSSDDGSSTGAAAAGREGTKVTPVLQWLLVANRRLDSRGIMQVASHRALGAMLDLSLSNSKGYLAIRASSSTNETRMLADLCRGVYHVPPSPLDVDALASAGSTTPESGLLQGPAGAATPTATPDDPLQCSAGLGHRDVATSSEEKAAAEQLLPAHASNHRSNSSGSSSSGLGDRSDARTNNSTDDAGRQCSGTSSSSARSDAGAAASGPFGGVAPGTASSSGILPPPSSISSSDDLSEANRRMRLRQLRNASAAMAAQTRAAARPLEQQRRIEALLDAAAALQRLACRRQSVLQSNNADGCSVLLQCEDRGMEGSVACLVAGWLHWYGRLPLQEALLSAELAINAAVDQELLEEATEALLEAASTRMMRTSVSWTHGGLSACVAGDVVGSWTNVVPLVACVNPRGCKGGASSGHFFLELEGLLPGTYLYKFIVDGTWTVDPQRHMVLDEAGNWNNVLEVITPPAVATSKERLSLARWQAAYLAHKMKLGLPQHAEEQHYHHR